MKMYLARALEDQFYITQDKKKLKEVPNRVVEVTWTYRYKTLFRHIFEPDRKIELLR